MKILLTGGGSGGHFYPLIAVAQSIREYSQKNNLIEPELFYMGPDEYDRDALFEQDITYIPVTAGKSRRYFSLKNVFDIFKMGWGSVSAFFKVYSLFPDVVFSKGGGASVPVVLAARLFGIPILVHESDVAPGRANVWAGKFAQAIAVSFSETQKAFDIKKDIALTGTPVRRELQTVAPSGAEEFLELEKGVPVVLFLGGSQGAELINDALLEALPVLLEKYQVIHQTGKEHIESIRKTADVVLQTSENPHRYKAFPFLNTLAMRMAAGAADVIVSRAGSTSLFEIAGWEKPSIIIPITDTNGDHQRKNAYAYARTGAAVVMEERNLTPHLLFSEIERLIEGDAEKERMKEAAHTFARPEAGMLIAEKLVSIALEHEE